MSFRYLSEGFSEKRIKKLRMVSLVFTYCGLLIKHLFYLLTLLALCNLSYAKKDCCICLYQVGDYENQLNCEVSKTKEQCDSSGQFKHNDTTYSDCRWVNNRCINRYEESCRS